MGIAISVALGVAVVMWAQTPNYSVLDASLTERDASDVINILQSNNIQHTIDPANGMILVESAKLHDAKMKLAAMGRPSDIAAPLDSPRRWASKRFVS